MARTSTTLLFIIAILVVAVASRKVIEYTQYNQLDCKGYVVQSGTVGGRGGCDGNGNSYYMLESGTIRRCKYTNNDCTGANPVCHSDWKVGKCINAENGSYKISGASSLAVGVMAVVGAAVALLL